MKVPIAPEAPAINNVSPAFKFSSLIDSNAVFPAIGIAAPSVKVKRLGSSSSDSFFTVAYSAQLPPCACKTVVKITRSPTEKSVTSAANLMIVPAPSEPTT